ncbi:unnamed protein product [Gemmata massiliana]|uniref:Uncharacterized protein n=1 Tax=Gemmata massiliana TaxID=1210884 RepID=A0A6P2DHW1_9BACT|nr:hypothetical protein [Gemmata massiliana]VTS00866.1 unnamed protein product [Gemmata massiliana]
MRSLAVALLVAFAAPVSAADKDEEKVKETTLTFVKAVKVKDLDAVMKTVDVPFVLHGKPIARSEELKDALKSLLEGVDPEKVAPELGAVLDGPAIRKKVEGRGLNEEREKQLADIEKVLGKTGYVVMLVRDGKERGGILVRIKDGQAKVVGIPK